MNTTAPHRRQQDEQRIALLTSFLAALPISLDLKATLDAVAQACHKTLPLHTTTYLLWQGAERERANMLFLRVQEQITQGDLQSVSQHIHEYLDTAPDSVQNHASWREQRTRRMSYELITGTLTDTNNERSFSTHTVIPVIHNENMVAMFHLSSTTPGAFPHDIVQHVQEVLTLALRTYTYIQRLGTAERDRMVDTFRSMSNGVILFDVTKRITLANPVAEQLIHDGVETGEQRLIPFLQQFQAEQGGDVSFAVEHAMTRGRETHIPLATFRERVYEIAATPVRDHQGVVTGGVLVLHDITHHIEVQRTKSEFLVLAAHQLRTPLSSMRWQLELLLDTEQLPPTTKDALQNTLMLNTRLSDMVNELLEVARLEQGITQEHEDELDLRTLVEATCSTLQTLATERSVTVTVSPGLAQLPHITLPAAWIARVLHEIIENAIVYTPSGGSVTIAAEHDDAHIILTVTDTGIGIPATEHKKVFASFARASNAMQKETDRSGLGLHVAQLYVTRWGGEITFTSTEGEGSTFTVTIPTTENNKKPV